MNNNNRRIPSAFKEFDDWASDESLDFNEEDYSINGYYICKECDNAYIICDIIDYEVDEE